MIEKFDYKKYAQDMLEQTKESVLVGLSEENQNYIKETVKDFAFIAGEAMSNDKDLKLTQVQKFFILQNIMEWTFNKSVDLCNSNISQEYWDGILQKIAYTIYEIARQAISRNIPQKQLSEAIEYHVVKVYSQEVEKVLKKNIVNNEYTFWDIIFLLFLTFFIYILGLFIVYPCITHLLPILHLPIPNQSIIYISTIPAIAVLYHEWKKG